MNTYGDQKTYITIDDDSNITERTNRVEAKSVSSNPVPKEKVKNKSKIIKNWSFMLWQLFERTFLFINDRRKKKIKIWDWWRIIG